MYAPHDLSSVEMRKWSKRRGVQGDVFEALDLDPRSEYKVRSLHLKLEGGVKGEDDLSGGLLWYSRGLC